ncbi:MAG: hypothetical protein GY951_01690 [Psychromonas sp.]|nr:hypothetical protein [Alteromonadales bacterium]MCP5076761.1 hypothetical protein [Psychromonas sp.]
MDFFSFDTAWQESAVYVVLSAMLYFSLLIITSLRVIIKRKPIGISLAWLFLIYTLPLLISKKDHGVGEWIDIMVRCTGPIIQQMLGLFIWDWYLETNRKMQLSKAEITRFLVVGEQNSQLIPSGSCFGRANIHQVLLPPFYKKR